MRSVYRVLLSFSLAGANAVLAAAWAAGPVVRAERVAPDVWFVQGEAAMGSSANRNFVSNAGFVATGAGVVVIDALGSPELGDELVAEIRRVTQEPIRWVVVTHYHADHVYGLQSLQAAGARVLGHPAARDYLGSEIAQRRLATSREELFPFVDETTRLVAPDVWMDGEEMVIRLGRREIVVRHGGPAHTPEDLVVLVRDAGVLFAGDLVFRGRIPFVGNADSRKWIASLDALIAWRPAVVVPGHGPASTAPAADLALTRDYLAHLRRTMGDAARNLEPFEEAYAKADWSRFESLPLFRAANRMNAYNTYLLMEQEAEK
jgi:glyoxylase-like metal-dependent hydrolase (beta-lactamase superfamily II)